MKFPLIALALLAVSCGEYKTAGVSLNKVGEIRAITSTQATATDRNNIVAVCNALAQKNAILSTAINSTHTFMAAQSDCTGNNMGSGLVETVLQNNGRYVFKRKADGLDFILPDVETNEDGVFADLCAAVSNLQNPVTGTSGLTYFSTSGINPADCTQASGEICVKLEKAFVNGNSATVHTKEWIRVRVSGNQGRIGFWTSRKKVTQSFCGANEALTYQATLR